MRKMFVFLLSIIFLISCDGEPKILTVSIVTDNCYQVTAVVKDSTGKTIRNEKRQSSSFIFYNLPEGCSAEFTGYDIDGMKVGYCNMALPIVHGEIEVELQLSGGLRLLYSLEDYQEVDTIEIYGDDGGFIDSASSADPVFSIPNSGNRNIEIVFISNGEEVGRKSKNVTFNLTEDTILDLGVCNFIKATRANLDFSVTNEAEILVGYDVPDGFEKIHLEINPVSKNASARNQHETIDQENRSFLLNGLEEGSEYHVYCYLSTSSGEKTAHFDEGVITSPIKLKEVSLVLEQEDLVIGSTAMVKAVRIPENATMLDEEGDTLFFSSDPSIAEISADGELTIKKSGKVEITYKETNNNISSTLFLDIPIKAPELAYEAEDGGLLLSFLGIDNDEVLCTLIRESGGKTDILLQDSSERSYLDNDIESGKTYTYTLSASYEDQKESTSISFSVDNPVFDIEIPTMDGYAIVIKSNYGQNSEIGCEEAVYFEIEDDVQKVDWILNGYSVASGSSFTYCLKDFINESHIMDAVSVQDLICRIEINGIYYSKTICIKVNMEDIEVVL